MPRKTPALPLTLRSPVLRLIMKESKTSLDWSNTGLTSLDSLHLFPDLRRLTLSKNHLTALTDLKFCPKLQELRLDHNSIPRIQDINVLKSLTVLDLGHNQIYRIEGFEQLTQLEQLDLSYNALTVLGNLWRLTELRRLNVAGNRLRSLGDLLANAKLEYLDASSNEIVSIEESGELLPLSIQALVLRSNRIQSVLSAKGLAGLTALEEVDLEENPFQHALEHQGVNYRVFVLYLLRDLRILSFLNGVQVSPAELHQVKKLSQTINPELLNYPEQVPYLLAFLAEKVPVSGMKSLIYASVSGEGAKGERPAEPYVGSPRDDRKLDLISRQLQELKEIVRNLATSEKARVSMQNMESPRNSTKSLLPRRKYLTRPEYLGTSRIDLKKIKAERAAMPVNQLKAVVAIQALCRKFIVRCRYLRYRRLLRSAITIQSVYRGYRVRKKSKVRRSRKSQGDVKTLVKQVEALTEDNKDLRNTVTKHEKALRYLFEQVASLQRSLKE